MNVFACDSDPVLAARFLADRHVVKMTIETAQILSTVAATLGLPHTYKPTHRHHPVVVAATENPAYLAWVVVHGKALAGEYRHRYGKTGKVHASEEHILGAAEILSHIWTSVNLDLVGAPLCMPDEHRSDDVVASYRSYLKVKYSNWGTMARWTDRPVPSWK